MSPDHSPRPSLTLREALSRLPRHLWTIWSHHPEEVVTQARWETTWILLLLLVLGRLGFGLLAVTRFSAFASQTLDTIQATHLVQVLTQATLSQVILAPVGVVLLMAVQCALAQAWGGRGHFLGQCYSFLLCFVPLTLVYSLINSVLAGLPGRGSIANGFLALAMLVVTLFINTVQLQRLHHLSVGKALACVLISSGVLALLATLGAAILLGLLFAPLHAGAR